MTYVDTRRLISRIQVIYTINFNTTIGQTTSPLRVGRKNCWDDFGTKLYFRKGYNHTQSWEEGCQTVSISTILDCTHSNAHLVLCIPFECSCVSKTDIRITVTPDNAHSVKKVFYVSVRFTLLYLYRSLLYPMLLGYFLKVILESKKTRLKGFYLTVALSQLGSEI